VTDEPLMSGLPGGHIEIRRRAPEETTEYFTVKLAEQAAKLARAKMFIGDVAAGEFPSSIKMMDEAHAVLDYLEDA